MNERERAIIVSRIKVDVGPATERHFSWRQFWASFKDWKTYVYAIMSLCACTPMYSLSMFMPSIIKGMGFTDLKAQAMSAPPYAVACLVTVGVSISADRRGERAFHVALPALLAVLGYILLVTLKDRGPAALYVSAIIAVTGAFAESPPKTSWFSNNFGGHTKRAVSLAIIIAIGNVGGALGGQVYRAQDAPHYVRGHEINLGLMAALAVISLGMKYVLYRINTYRAQLSPEEYRIACEGEELCDKVSGCNEHLVYVLTLFYPPYPIHLVQHPDFKYIL